MSGPNTHRITALLSRWESGDKPALDQLEPLVHEALLFTARRLLGNEWNKPTLEPAELVNEAWIKILEADSLVMASRGHFYNLAGRIMKRFLINRAVAKKAAKNHDWLGLGVVLVYPENLDEICGADGTILLELDQALDRFKLMDARKERIFNLYCFCGFQQDQIAELEHLSVTTVKRELRFTFAWLKSELDEGDSHAKN